MRYRVLIPTAGTGSRLGEMTRFVNKSLVSVANRPIICHIIEQFPDETEFVIALGHKGNLVRDFLELAYPEKPFYFAEVYPFEGPGSGLGLSVLACMQYLQQPFIFTSCDTLVKNAIPAPNENWMGYAGLSELDQYRTLELSAGEVKAICEKGAGKIGTHMPYIGLAGIKDYEVFWNAMKNGEAEAVLTGESHGLRALVANKIKAHEFSWFDTGLPSALAKTREAYREADEPNILEKANEAIWFVGNKVIKFSDDKKFIYNRVERAESIGEFIPEIVAVKSNMYAYRKVEGCIMSNAVTMPLFQKLLDFSKTFWQTHQLNEVDSGNFRKACLKFYKDKTLERIDMFFKNFNKKDGAETINGVKVPAIKKILEKVDWNWLVEGLPGRFHGDFHFENIIYSDSTESFTFLDWRQEFGGILTTGDIYYDLAKLLHGLIICHELIAGNHFSVQWNDKEIRFDFLRKQMLVKCEQYYSEWLIKNGYEPKKVRVLTALVYLNIAALHHYPYCLLLYALGKDMLHKELAEECSL